MTASIPSPKVGIEYFIMHNNNGVPLIEYTSPRIGDWKNLRQLIENSFPSMIESSVSYLIRNGMSKMIVARCEQQILGFCYFEEFSRSKLHLLKMATDKNYYQRGIASQLLKYLDSYAIDRGYGSIVLTVKKNNLAAKRLYEKMGYVLTRGRKSENKESWEKILNGECAEPVIKYGFWRKNYYPLRVSKKMLYRYMAY